MRLARAPRPTSNQKYAAWYDLRAQHSHAERHGGRGVREKLFATVRHRLTFPVE